MEFTIISDRVKNTLSIVLDYKKAVLQWNIRKTHGQIQPYRLSYPKKPTVNEILQTLNTTQSELSKTELKQIEFIIDNL
jgi:hypothetical protein